MTDYQALINRSEPFALAGYPWVRTLRAALIEATADRAEHDRQEREKAWDEGYSQGASPAGRLPNPYAEAAVTADSDPALQGPESKAIIAFLRENADALGLPTSNDQCSDCGGAGEGGPSTSSPATCGSCGGTGRLPSRSGASDG